MDMIWLMAEQLADHYAAAVLLLLAVVYIVHEKVTTLRRQRDVLIAARTALRAFYIAADRLLTSPEVPPTVKSALYDMVRITTNPEFGARVFETFVREVDNMKRAPATSLEGQMAALARRSPALAAEIVHAMQSGLTAFILANCHRNAGLSLTFVQAQEQPVRIAEVVEHTARRLGVPERDGELQPA